MQREFRWRFIVSSVLELLFNPRVQLQNLLLSAGQIVATRRALRAGTEKVCPVVMRPPFLGSWQVLNGGVTRDQSHSWHIIGQRFAYDFVPHRCDGIGPRDSDCPAAMGQPVVAPASGVVVEMRDGIRDLMKPGSGWVDWRAPDIRGNYVIIEHAAHVYSLLAHLRCNSIRVREGQQVECGDQVGECGNSGRSTEPHIHFHVQKNRSFYFGIGVPIAFQHCVVEAGEDAALPDPDLAKVDRAELFVRAGQKVLFDRHATALHGSLQPMLVLEPSDLRRSVLLFVFLAGADLCLITALVGLGYAIYAAV